MRDFIHQTCLVPQLWTTKYKKFIDSKDNSNNKKSLKDTYKKGEE